MTAGDGTTDPDPSRDTPPAWSPPGVPPAPPPPAPQWGAPPPQWAPPPAPGQWGAPLGSSYAPPPPPPPAKRRRGRAIILVLVGCLVVAGATVGGWLLLSSSDRNFTLNGAKIDDPQKVLSDTERTIDSIVSTRHGVSSDDTRCYFGRPHKQPSGANSDDVEPALQCGPVLFVDGDPSKTYLTFRLVTASTAKDTVSVVTGASPDQADPIAVPDSLDLSRPDGKHAPNNGALQVPKPPAAAKNAIVTSDLGPVAAPKQLDHSSMIGLHAGVKLLSVGVVPRYGHGDEARSAPPGEQLIAFQLADKIGEAGNQPSDHYLTFTDSAGSHGVPIASSTDDYVVIAEPLGATPKLVLKDAGVTQTLTLPSGKPGAHNLTVLTRQHRVYNTTKSAAVVLNASGGASGSITFPTTFNGARLEYWLPTKAKDHATRTSDALLVATLYYTDADQPGDHFAWEPELLSLKLPSGAVVRARQVTLSGDRVLTVFQVPASFTKGTLAISGSEQLEGVTVSVGSAVTFPISITKG